MTDPKEKQRQQLSDRGICVVIPTYNNGGTIAAVVKATLTECRDVIVVNDGSTDDTSEILHAIGGITIVEYAENRGKGSALKHGFRQALQMGFAYAITLDGDGQHYPDDISLFLKANRQHPGCLIIGNRQMDGIERSWGSSFANGFSNFWFFIQTGCRLPDTQSGYRLYPLRKLHALRLLGLLSLSRLLTSRYEAELELLVFASWHGVEIVSMPVRVYYPPMEQRVSHFRPLKDFARISVLNTVLCLLAIVYGWPMRLWRLLADVTRTVYTLLLVLTACVCVITPAVWFYVKIGKITEKKRRNLHRLIYHACRFLMLRHGIPGTTFTYYDGANGADGANEANGANGANGANRTNVSAFAKPAVIICNHQSHIDLPCQMMLTPDVVFLTKEREWNSPLYGLLIREAEYYSVAEGIDTLMPKLRSLVERGYSIAVYPEGTRSKNCQIGPFHKGAFHIAEQLGLDIVPMYLYGPGRVLPKGSYRLRRGQIYLEVGTPITREQLAQIGNTKAQASYIRKHYIAKYEQMANRIEQDV